MKKNSIHLLLQILAITVLFSSVESQVIIDTLVSGPEMAENLLGPGISAFDNVSVQGSQHAYGTFTGAWQNLGIASGAVLCTGNASDIPGPNNSSNTGTNNGTPGHPLLQYIATGTTHDAVVLSFDFIPENDTLRVKYVFGSEEYNEDVGTIFNDLCGIFITGPNPAGGYYVNINFANVPGSAPSMSISINNVNNGYSQPGNVPVGPCQNCAYFSDNTYGQYLEYDGFTVVLEVWALVIPQELYHIELGVADVESTGKDSGLFLAENGLFSPGSAVFTSFDFMKVDNPSLPFDIIGVIDENEVHLEVPEGTDLTSLIASFTEPGAYVEIGDEVQVSGVTVNDFTFPLVYTLKGHSVQDWTVFVDIVSNIEKNIFSKVSVGPNPLHNELIVAGAKGCRIRLMDLMGQVIWQYDDLKTRNSIPVDALLSGMYFVELSKDGIRDTRRIIKQ